MESAVCQVLFDGYCRRFLQNMLMLDWPLTLVLRYRGTRQESGK